MKISASYNPKLDAENYVRSIYDQVYDSYGRKSMRENLINQIESPAIKKVLNGKEESKEVFKKIKKELQSNKEYNKKISAKAKRLSGAWDEVGSQIEWYLSFLYQKPFPFKSIEIFYTTIPVCPYDFKARVIFVHADAPIEIQLNILMHELNHFMFYYYYDDLRKELDQNKFELLKESLTLFTNPEWRGKPYEKSLRKLFITKNCKNIKDAVEKGKKFLLK